MIWKPNSKGSCLSDYLNKQTFLKKTEKKTLKDESVIKLMLRIMKLLK